jgi:hypothetical protein
MSLIYKSVLQNKAGGMSELRAKSFLDELTRAQAASTRQYDVFLSHAFKDAVIVYGIYKMLTAAGLTVFVDWISSPGVDRTQVTPANAAYLRKSMDQSLSLLYAATQNAGGSKWMPWELGYMDGRKRPVGILPVGEVATNNDYSGQEYLGLYPYVTAENLSALQPAMTLRRSAVDSIGTLKSWATAPSRK